MNTRKVTYTCLFILAVFVLTVAYFNNNDNSLQKIQANSQVFVKITPKVSLQSITNGTSQTASAVLANTKTIKWQTSSYPAGAGVNINLIRQISTNPNKFTLVRTIAVNTPNDGEESWVPKAGENSNDLYVELTCSTTYEFASGCKTSDNILKVN